MTTYNNSFDGALPWSDNTVRFALATNVAQTYTVPGASSVRYRATFSYLQTSNVYVGYNATPTTPPPGTNVTGSRIEFRPDVRYVKGGDVLTLITGDASAQVGISLLSLPS